MNDCPCGGYGHCVTCQGHGCGDCDGTGVCECTNPFAAYVDTLPEYTTADDLDTWQVHERLTCPHCGRSFDHSRPLDSETVRCVYCARPFRTGRVL